MRQVTLSLIGRSASKSSRLQLFPVKELWEPQRLKECQLRRLEYEKLSENRIAHYHGLIITMLAGEEAQRRFDPGSVRRHQAASDFDRPR
jgi:hypothetical protein